MTIRHLQIFKTVCDNMSITKAADKLNMSQPAVSISIKELESFYQTKLFDRVGRKIHPTETGERLFVYAKSILNGFEDSVSDIRDASNLKICRIGVNVTLAESYLSSIVKLLKERIPDISLKLYINNNREIEEHLAENNIDFALLDTPTNMPNRVIQKLFEEEMCLICSPDLLESDEVTMEELAEIPLLLRENGSGCRRCIDREFKKVGKKPYILTESISSKSLMNLAESGIGMTISPAYVENKYLKKKNLKKIKVTDGRFVRRYFLTYLSHKYQSPTVKNCLSLITDFFGNME